MTQTEILELVQILSPCGSILRPHDFEPSSRGSILRFENVDFDVCVNCGFETNHTTISYYEKKGR